MARQAPREATELARSALDILEGGDGEVEPGWELELQTTLGFALIATQGWSSADAERALLRARELAEGSGLDEERARNTVILATLDEVQGRYRRSERLLEESLGSATPGPGTLVDSHELLACTLFHQGAFEDALESAERGLAVLDSAYHNPLTAAYGDHPGVGCHI